MGRAIVRQSLAAHGAIIVVGSANDAIALANRIAPEHLVVDRESLTRRPLVAGAVFIGPYTAQAAGDYAAQTLAALKLTDTVKDKLVFGINVRQVLFYVERSEVEAGIVYRTDALEAGDKVKLVATADESTHAPIVYPAVVIKGAKHADAGARFLEFLASDKAQAILAARGFKPAKAADGSASRPDSPAK